MPRKSFVVTIAIATALLAAAARPALAQPRWETKPVQLFIDLGYINLFDFPKWIFLGPELEIRLGRGFSLNPEVSIWASQNLRGGVQVVPGATANVHIGRFIVGAGAVRRVPDWSESAGGWLVPKAQLSYLAGPSRLTLTCIYLNTTKDVAIGMTIGMGLGRPSRD